MIIELSIIVQRYDIFAVYASGKMFLNVDCIKTMQATRTGSLRK